MHLHRHLQNPLFRALPPLQANLKSQTNPYSYIFMAALEKRCVHAPAAYRSARSTHEQPFQTKEKEKNIHEKSSRRAHTQPRNCRGGEVTILPISNADTSKSATFSRRHPHPYGILILISFVPSSRDDANPPSPSVSNPLRVHIRPALRTYPLCHISVSVFNSCCCIGLRSWPGETKIGR